MSTTLSVEGEIAVVTIDNPPVNATGRAVRQALADAVASTEHNPDIKAVVLQCAGSTFVAGADIREFGKPPLEPHLPDVLVQIENATKPWVAAVHGSALGGGLELAMACHYRIATPQARFGLPEVTLGLIPGAGGTIRLPRLVSAETALDMVAGGKPITAPKALEAGLIDEISGGQLAEDALAFAAKVMNGKTHVPTLDRSVNMPKDRGKFDLQASIIRKKARGHTAPSVAVTAVQNALSMPAADALAAERAAFIKLKSTPQSTALRHIFFAERATARIDRIKDVSPRDISHIGVVGGGTMGAGITAACLLAGLDVTLLERDNAAAELGQDRVLNILSGSLKRGLVSAENHLQMLAGFRTATEYVALKNAQVVIEAVFEDMAVKKEVFAQLDATVRPDAILATNTSYLDVNEIAAALSEPGRVIGLHFFSPAHIMKLLEIVVPDQVADDVLATSVALAKRLRKIPVLAGVCDGFIGNRIMSAYRRECDYMLEDGAFPHEIDTAMRAFGFKMGIYQMQDLAGLEIAWAMRKRRAATRDPAERYVDIPDKLCEMGRFGRKTGCGWHNYNDGKEARAPEVKALIISEAKRKGITRKNFSADDIMRRILKCMQSEAQLILSEGIASSADDIDVVMVNAYGFPRWMGGPLHLLNADVGAATG